MKKVGLLLMLLSCSTQCATISCRDDSNTKQYFCYLPNEIRANGDLRSFPLFTGGPKGVSRTGQTVVVNCKAGYMELRDRKGVVFARNYPAKPHIIQVRDDVCEEKNIKRDASLD